MGKWVQFHENIFDFGGGASKIKKEWLNASRRSIDALRAVLTPYAEINRLKEKIKSIQAEDRTAIQHAIHIMAENDRLKEFLVGRTIPPPERENLRKERDEAVWKYERVCAALNKMESEWREYIARGAFVGPHPFEEKKPVRKKKPVKKG